MQASNADHMIKGLIIKRRAQDASLLGCFGETQSMEPRVNQSHRPLRYIQSTKPRPGQSNSLRNAIHSQADFQHVLPHEGSERNVVVEIWIEFEKKLIERLECIRICGFVHR